MEVLPVQSHLINVLVISLCTSTNLLLLCFSTSGCETYCRIWYTLQQSIIPFPFLNFFLCETTFLILSACPVVIWTSTALFQDSWRLFLITVMHSSISYQQILVHQLLQRWFEEREIGTPNSFLKSNRLLPNTFQFCKFIFLIIIIYSLSSVKILLVRLLYGSNSTKQQNTCVTERH